MSSNKLNNPFRPAIQSKNPFGQKTCDLRENILTVIHSGLVSANNSN
jgi:hypothetical protein